MYRSLFAMWWVASVAASVTVAFAGTRPGLACGASASVRATLPRVERTIAELEARGVIHPRRGTPDHPLLDFPLRPAAHLDQPGFYYILGHYDHDFTNGLLDYDCGDRTHNSGDGAHSGIDYNLHPFDWKMMDEADVEVVAAAPGVIVLRFDGFYDRSCPGNAGPDWNGVTLRHDDGSLAYYVHFKSGSVTPKQIGQSVEAGEYLGVVGSSGPSISPHLHFQLYDHTPQRNDIDPYAGPCNDFNDESWWADQPPYVDPGINLLSTHDAQVQFAPCGQQDTPSFSDLFAPGAFYHVYTFGRDGTRGDLYEYEVLDPDGVVVDSWSVDFQLADFLAGYYLTQYRTIPASAALGTYTLRLEHLGAVHEHTFEVESEVPVDADSGDGAGIASVMSTPITDVRPNPAESTARIRFSIERAGPVSLVVLDVAGRVVRVLHDGHLTRGVHERVWDGRDRQGGPAPSGVYFLRLRSPDREDVRRIARTR